MPFDVEPVQLKASFYTITVLQLNECHPTLIEAALQRWIANTPQLLQGMPVIIDVPSEVNPSALKEIVACVRRYGLMPVGIQGVNKEHSNIVNELNLALFSRQKRDMSQPKIATEKENVRKVAPLNSPTIVESVRSGQQITAKGDLIILQSVSLGAEISAEGNIHVYGTLAGRAFAGTQGNKKACIFCHKIEAELIAIAGCYWQYEDLQKSLDKTNLQIYLANESLNVRLLG